MNDQERAFVESFIEPARRERYLHLLDSPKLRAKALDRLNHQLDLRAGVATALAAGLTCSEITELLHRRGADHPCHVIADSSDLDGQEMPLAAAVEFAIRHPFGVVLCCVPGHLAVYKPESPGPTFLLSRDSDSK